MDAIESKVIKTLGVSSPDGWLVEYLYDEREQKARLAWRDKEGQIGSGESVTIDGQEYAPAKPDSYVERGVVRFACNLGMEMTFHELREELEKYIAIFYGLAGTSTTRVLAYWVMLSWIYDCFNSTVYLRLAGSKVIGKNTVAWGLGLVSYRATTWQEYGISSCAMRLANRYHGTMVLDDAEIDLKKDESDMINFYNMGAMRGNPIWRVEENWNVSNNETTFALVALNVFCPKILTMRNAYHEDAIDSRTITFRLIPNESFVIDHRLENEIRTKAEALQRNLMSWRLKVWRPEIKIKQDYQDVRISGRLNQLMGMLMSAAEGEEKAQRQIWRDFHDLYALSRI